MSSADRPATVPTSRRVERIVKGQPTTDGAGVNLLRVLRQPEQQRLDPFLMLDEFRSDDADDYIAGFPDHPHRGFETVTYMLAGNMRHQDSSGHTGNLRAGSVQWMTAGRGIIHSEMPQQEAGLMHGFQLWINLPSAQKLCAPRYQEYEPEEIPERALDGGGRIRVIAGRSNGCEGPVRDIATAPLYVDIELPPATTLDHPIAADHNAFVYVFDGSLYIGPEGGGQSVAAGELAILSNEAAAGVSMATCDTGARLLLLAGRPLGEPIAQWGPFVMNSSEEIEQALDDYRQGRLAPQSH